MIEPTILTRSLNKSAVDAYYYHSKKPNAYSRDLYMEVNKLFNQYAVEEILTGSTIHIPNLGKFWIKKYKMNYNKPAVDYGETRKQGKVVYFLNNEGDYIGTIKWSKPRKKEYRQYVFKPARSFKNKTSAILKQPGGHKRFTER